ncbi:C2H2-type domain-containing protein [Mycena chlorophos]|uniref:C2H2-type domain-containing protein n=1 Tax=Mycena chlorophos TaxID=658473 RepID=A0A8H6TKX5_MYCCL|nr:C2H2-type domain-containing protein [Mycena chlorophos]
MPKSTKPRRRPQHKPEADLPCTFPGCKRLFRSAAAVTNHVRSDHRNANRVSSPSAPPSPVQSDDGFMRDDPPMSDMPSPGPNAGSRESPDPSEHGHRERLPKGYNRVYHPFLNARPCDEDGNYLPEGAEPAPRRETPDHEWAPYEDEVAFRVADLLFRKAQMSGTNITELLELWALDKAKHDDFGPFENAQHLYETIDDTKLGDAPWKCLVTEPLADGDDAPEWARRSYEVWYRDPAVVIENMLDNPDFNGLFDPVPYVETDNKDKRRWSDFMSANFPWRHADVIYEEDPTTEGAMICPLFFGADKTTVSVGTGGTDYHPGYISVGNLHSSARRAHRQGVVPIVFLSIPKSTSFQVASILLKLTARTGDRKYDNDPAFRNFKRQLYHASWAAVLSTLKPGMTKPVVLRCPDGHFRRVIYDFGPFIADYPEQVLRLLAGVVQGWCTKCTAPAHDLDGPLGTRRNQEFTNDMIDAFDGDPKQLWENYGINTDVIPFTNDFPRADIHEMLSPDLLHQLIKGTFKDHLVEWVGEYLDMTSAVFICLLRFCVDHLPVPESLSFPLFPGLRRFKDGRRFTQWTGDDSKALMKVYLPALEGLLPSGVIAALSSFLDFCYLVRRRDFDETTLQMIDDKVQEYHQRREIFRTAGVRADFSLPRQHSMIHYRWDIMQFGAPYGVCSSITESRHITAVKKPWRRSNRFDALGQMLLTNQRLDKLAASRADFEECGPIHPLARRLPDQAPKVGDEEEEEAVDDAHVKAPLCLPGLEVCFVCNGWAHY